MSLIAELDPKDLPMPAPRAALGAGLGGARFAEVLARLRGRPVPARAKLSPPAPAPETATGPGSRP
jgi:hypothetical protein